MNWFNVVSAGKQVVNKMCTEILHFCEQTRDKNYSRKMFVIL